MARKPLSKRTERLLWQAVEEAKSLGHSYVGSEHVLLAILGGGHEGDALRYMGWESGVYRSLLLGRLGRGGRLPLPQGLSPGMLGILSGAAREAKRLQSGAVEPEHLLLSISRRENCAAAALLRDAGTDLNAVFSAAYTTVQLRRSQVVKKEAAHMKLLEQFCEDLVEKAVRMEPVIGRTRETEMVMEVLCRKNKNNPALIGEPGVGKTAIVEGLAQRMAAGSVPEPLRQKRLLSLNLASVLAGTKYRGEFEERVRDLVQEIGRSGNVILFVDEMHTIVGAGSAEGAIDAANLLKPALGRGEIQMIGATTLSEYRRHIEKDAALERRFRPVMVREPSPSETGDILRGLRPGLERHHRIRISDEAISAAVTLSCRYLTGSFLPDKAVDLLDEGAARCAIRGLFGGSPELEIKRQKLAVELETAVRENRFEQAASLRDELQSVMRGRAGERHGDRVVGVSDIADTVAARTGIPAGRLTLSERERMRMLEETLATHIVGQPEAVRAVAAAVRRGRVGLGDGKRPVASMLFMGPTGVGKTALCKILSEVVYGDADALIRLDMSEYMEAHAISRLIGAPPGYVGHEEGGTLVEKVRRRPYCVVLFDEMEKAHRDVCGVLLQIMEDGVLTDSMGRRADFCSAIVIMTSNLGKSGGALGFGEGASVSDRELHDRFAPEFLGRIDCIARFRRLSEEDLQKITDMQLVALRTRAGKLGTTFSWDERVCQAIAQAGVTGGAGARNIRHLIRDRVEEPLSELLLRGTRDTVCATAANGEIRLS